MKKAIGRRGSWFATVDGESLPCVHEHWFQGDGWYRDPGARPGERVWDEFIAGINSAKKVILTKDIVSADEIKFERDTYVAVFRVDDIIVESGVLKFRFVERLFDLKP